MNEILQKYKVGLWDSAEAYAAMSSPRKLLEIEATNKADACHRADLATHRVFAVIRVMEDENED